MTFDAPTYIAFAPPLRIADYARGRRERYDTDLAPLSVEITLGTALRILVGRIQLPIVVQNRSPRRDIHDRIWQTILAQRLCRPSNLQLMKPYWRKLIALPVSFRSLAPLSSDRRWKKPCVIKPFSLKNASMHWAMNALRLSQVNSMSGKTNKSGSNHEARRYLLVHLPRAG